MKVTITTEAVQVNLNMEEHLAMALIMEASKKADTFEVLKEGSSQEQKTIPIAMDRQQVVVKVHDSVEGHRNVVMKEPANMEEAGFTRTKQSRVERMFGRKDDWDMPAQRKQFNGDREGYSGFLAVRCEHCGKVKLFFPKKKITYYICSDCGERTQLSGLIPMHIHCECGKNFKYLTNMTDENYTYSCINCGSPVELRRNAKGTAYTTIGENTGGGFKPQKHNPYYMVE